MNAPHDLPEVFVIGSSTTLLFGPYLEQYLAGSYRYSRKGNEPDAQQAAMANLDVPTGASAGDSNRVLAYLQTLDTDPSFHPDVVLLQVGMHDLKKDPATGKHQVPLPDYRKNVAAIVAWFDARPSRLVWLTSGPLDEALHNQRMQAFHRYEADLNAYNEAAAIALSHSDATVLDLAGFTRRLGPLQSVMKDHVHLHDEFVRLQAAFIAGYLLGLPIR